MADNKKRGLGSPKVSEETKKRVSEAGHEAQGDQTSDNSEEAVWEETAFMEINGRDLDEMEEDDTSSKKGMGSPNYPEDVAEDARRKGGEHSHGGGRPKQDEE